MDAGLGIALSLASHIVFRVSQTKTNNEDIKALSGYVRALKPLLQSLIASDVDASQPVQDLLLEGLRKARDLVDKFAAMRGSFERFIRSVAIKEEMAIVRRVVLAFRHHAQALLSAARRVPGGEHYWFCACCPLHGR